MKIFKRIVVGAEVIFIIVKYGIKIYNLVKPIIKDLSIGGKQTMQEIKGALNDKDTKQYIKDFLDND